MAAVLTLHGVSKSFGKTKAVDRLSLEIEQGTVFTLLGPSGCGKTTTLRMLAGLDRPDEGDIYLKGRPIVSIGRRIFVNPEKRNMGMVFQSYAIWPHMTVFRNVAFPLALRRLKRATIREKVRGALNLVGLDGLEDRPATQLSGGQQQRVAIARALVYEPEVLLLDEPLSNLDSKLREQMRVDLKLLQKKLGVTLVYVTHDQSEAMSLSDHVVVLNCGRVEQQGTARSLYDAAQTPFVRDFLGRTILLKAWLRALGPDGAVLELSSSPGTFLRCAKNGDAGFAVGQEVCLSVRPEDVGLTEFTRDNGDNTLNGTIETTLFGGERSECQVRVGTEMLTLYLPRDKVPTPNEAVSIRLPRRAIRMWPL